MKEIVGKKLEAPWMGGKWAAWRGDDAGAASVSVRTLHTAATTSFVFSKLIFLITRGTNFNIFDLSFMALLPESFIDYLIVAWPIDSFRENFIVAYRFMQLVPTYLSPLVVMWVPNLTF